MSYYSLFVIMQDNEFFVRCNISSNICNPEIKLDGIWEVAAYDLALGTSSNIGRSHPGDICTTSY